jgi:hypothetical protein
VKRSTVAIVVFGVVLTLASGACRNREKSGAAEASTQTIEPAKPQPDTDTAPLTQTVDVEGGRSEVEARTTDGAELSTSGGSSTAPATTTTQSATTGTTVTTTTR